MNTFVSSHYSGIKYFLPVVGVLLLGLVAGLLGYVWVWPLAVGSAVALVIWILAKKVDVSAQKFFNGLAMTFFFSALMLGIFGFIAVAVAAL
jgi:hypothetical protein